jgi:hypothetical protein
VHAEIHKAIIVIASFINTPQGIQPFDARASDWVKPGRPLSMKTTKCGGTLWCRRARLFRRRHEYESTAEERNGEMVFLDNEIAGAADGDPLSRLAHETRVTALLERMKLP